MKELPNAKEVLISTLTKLIDQFAEFVPRFIFAFFILFIGYVLAKLLAIVTKKYWRELVLTKSAINLTK